MKASCFTYRSSLITILFLVVGLALFVHTARGQEKLIERIRVQNQESQKILNKADRLKENGYLNQAASHYLTLLKKHKDAVVKTDPHIYRGVPTVVRNRIASWSEEEQTKFKNLMEGKAASQFQKAKRSRNPQLFKEVALTYFLTDYAQSAAESLARDAFKQGNLSSAIFWWNHLLKFHSEALNSHDVRKRIAFALQSIDDKTQFQQLRKDVKANEVQISSSFPSTQSKTVRLSQRSNQMVYNWPRPGGNRTGTGRVPSHFESYIPGQYSKQKSRFVHLWNFPVSGSTSSGRFIPITNENESQTKPDTVFSSPKSEFIHLTSDSQTDYNYSPILPIVYNDQVYIHDSSNVFAFDLKHPFASNGSRDRHLKWSFPNNRQRIDKDAVETAYTRTHGLISLESYAGHLYFHRYQANTLHRIQARTGSQVFQTHAPEIDGDRLQFNGTPIVTDEGVFVPLIRRFHDDIDIYLGRFDRNNGTLDWLRLIGSALNTRGYRRSQLPTRESFTHLLSFENQIVLSTNMGFISSVNAVTGEIDWVHNYSTYELLDQTETPWPPEQHSTRGLKPPRILNNRLYVLPRDNAHFLGVNIRSGELELKYRMPDAVRFLDHGTVNITEKGPAAFFVKKGGEKYSLSILSLAESTPEEMELDKSFSQLPSVSPGKKRIILGRKQNIWSMKRENAYLKLSREWPGGTNLPPHEMIATGNRIILVGPAGVAVFTTLDQLVQQLGSELGTQPLFPFNLFMEH